MYKFALNLLVSYKFSLIDYFHAFELVRIVNTNNTWLASNIVIFSHELAGRNVGNSVLGQYAHTHAHTHLYTPTVLYSQGHSFGENVQTEAWTVNLLKCMCHIYTYTTPPPPHTHTYIHTFIIAGNRYEYIFVCVGTL